MFKPFVRIESHLRIKTLDTGLGLYLTRKLLSRLLGGEITVTSEASQGIIFSIYLPAKLPKMAMQNQTSNSEDSTP